MTVLLVLGGFAYVVLIVLALALAKMCARGDGRFDTPEVHPVHRKNAT